MVKFIPVNTPKIDGNEKKYLNECIETGWISSEGPFVTRFESEMAKLCQRRHGIAVSNGSAALDIAIRAAGISPGDEVILPAFTIISCSQAITNANAIPVVVDCNCDTWNMDIADIEAAITERTKAIMAVHIYGLAVNMHDLVELARKHDLIVIEDAAEAIGMSICGKPAGSWGHVSTMSFYPNKLITTGEGGMVLTNCEKIKQRAQSLRNLCFTPERRFVHDEIGWNYRLTNLQAALGCAQIEKIDEHMDKKQRIGKFYQDNLNEIKHIKLPKDKLSFAKNCYWIFGIVINSSSKHEAQYYMSRLHELGVGTRPFFWPIHLQPVYKKSDMFENVSCPNSEYIALNGFYIPSGLGLTQSDLEHVATSMHEVFS